MNDGESRIFFWCSTWLWWRRETDDPWKFERRTESKVTCMSQEQVGYGGPARPPAAVSGCAKTRPRLVSASAASGSNARAAQRPQRESRPRPTAADAPRAVATLSAGTTHASLGSQTRADMCSLSLLRSLWLRSHTMSRRKQARPIRHLESDADVDDRLTSGEYLAVDRRSRLQRPGPAPSVSASNRNHLLWQCRVTHEVQISAKIGDVTETMCSNLRGPYLQFY